MNQIALKAVLPSVFITRSGGIKWVDDDLCKATVRAQFDVLFFFIFVQLCQCINACYLPTHSSSIRSVLVIKVGLHWASATQWAVKSTLHAFSKHGSKPHIVVAGTVKMPVSLKKKVAEWYKNDNELCWQKRWRVYFVPEYGNSWVPIGPIPRTLFLWYPRPTLVYKVETLYTIFILLTSFSLTFQNGVWQGDMEQTQLHIGHPRCEHNTILC